MRKNRLLKNKQFQSLGVFPTRPGNNFSQYHARLGFHAVSQVAEKPVEKQRKVTWITKKIEKDDERVNRMTTQKALAA